MSSQPAFERPRAVGTCHLSLTFGELLFRHVQERPQNLAVISHQQGVNLAYKELEGRSTALAKSFHEYGVCRGDKVAIIFGSRTEYIEAFFACAKLGAALVLLNYAFIFEEVGTALTAVAPKLVIITPKFNKFDYTDHLPRLSGRLPSLQALILVDPHKLELQELGPKMVPYESLIKNHPSIDIDLAVSPHDIVNVQFTSGSTGIPKAVVKTS